MTSLKRHRGKLVVDWVDDTGRRHRERVKGRAEGEKRRRERGQVRFLLFSNASSILRTFRTSCFSLPTRPFISK